MIAYLDVLDTAFKIGLGSVITGVTTYLTTRHNHDYELVRAAIEDASALLKEGALKLEKSSTELNNALQEYDFAVLHPDEVPDMKATLALLVFAYNDGKDAKALFYLIGVPNLAKLVVSYLNAIDSIRGKVRNHKHGVLPKHNPLNTHIDEALTTRNAILEALGQTYETIRNRRPGRESRFVLPRPTPQTAVDPK